MPIVWNDVAYVGAALSRIIPRFRQSRIPEGQSKTTTQPNSGAMPIAVLTDGRCEQAYFNGCHLPVEFQFGCRFGMTRSKWDSSVAGVG